MRTASVVFSLPGFALVLLVYTAIAPYALDPQRANLLTTDPGTYGVGIGYALVFMIIVGYPLCLLGAGFAFGAALKRNRPGIALAPVGLSVLGVLTGCSAAWNINDHVDTTALILLGIPLAIPVVSVVVVAIITLRPGPAPVPKRDLGGTASAEAVVSTPWPPLLSTDELWPPGDDQDRRYEYCELRLVTRSVKFRCRAGFEVLAIGDGKEDGNRMRQSEEFELPLYQSQWDGDGTLQTQRAELVSSLQAEGWQPVSSVRREDVILPRFRRAMAWA